MAADSRPLGLLASLRSLLSNLAELAEVRLGLFGTELQQEKARLLESFAWLGVALLALCLGTVLLSLLLVLLVAEPHRLAMLGCLALLYLAAAWMAWQRACARLRAGGAAFAASLAELRRDRAALTGQPGAGAAPP